MHAWHVLQGLHGQERAALIALAACAREGVDHHNSMRQLLAC